MGKSFRTLPMKLASFVESYNTAYSSGTAGLSRLNEGIRLSATMLVITPLLALYLVLQRQFIEGIESTGLTGE